MRTKKKVEKVEAKKSLGKLKDDILEQVRLLSSGKISTAFPLVQLGKELIARENDEATEGDF